MLHLYTECALSARSVRGSVSGRAGARALARRASTAHSRRPARVLAMAGGRESERKQVDAPVSVPSTPPAPAGQAGASGAGGAGGGDETLNERLAALKQGAQSGDSPVVAPPAAAPNIFAATAEEARQITVPSLPAVLGSTAVVLGIVAASTLSILGVNALLSEAASFLFG